VLILLLSVVPICQPHNPVIADHGVDPSSDVFGRSWLCPIGSGSTERSAAQPVGARVECAREGASNCRGVWGVGSRQSETGWHRCEGGWYGGLHSGWKPHSAVGRRLEGATTRRWRCFEGGPNVSTLMRFVVSSLSIVWAKAIAVVPAAPDIAANSFGA
jgi:hypothetical protein